MRVCAPTCILTRVCVLVRLLDLAADFACQDEDR